MAATRVTVVNVPQPDAGAENPVVKRAKARATRAQLLADLNGLQNRQRKLPEDVTRAEKEACYTEQDQYDPCPDGPTGVSEGTDRGQVEVATDGNEYTLVSHSVSGNDFTVEKHADSTTTRSCTTDGSIRGGCDGGDW